MNKPYFGYIRVSTARQGEEGVSLPEQRDAIERYAGHLNLPIRRWFEDRLTATRRGRPAFEAMLKALAAGAATGVFIHKIDRSIRNLGEWNDVTELIERGYEVHVAHDGIDLTTRSGRLTGDMLAVIAADYSRNLREEVKKGIYGRMKQGLLPRPAPLGYLDNGGGQPKSIDPTSGPLIRNLFELYATGRFSHRGLMVEAKRLGLRARKGRPLRLNQLAGMLRNPFYAGVIRVIKTGQSFPGIHPPLVSRTVFDRVQQVLDGKAPRRAIVHDFLFRRLLTCGHCGRHLIGERQKGRVYYRCQVPDCPTTTAREDMVEAHLLQLLRPMQLAASDRDELLAVLNEFRKDEQVGHLERSQARRLRLTNVGERQQRLTDAYLEGAIDKAELEQRKTALLMERRELEDAAAMDSDANVGDSATEFLELVSRAYLLYENALPHERRELVEIMTSNRLVEGRTPRFTLSSPFADFSKETQQQSGGPPRSRARTGATVKRLLKLMSHFLISSKASALCQRVHEVVHPNAAAKAA